MNDRYDVFNGKRNDPMYYEFEERDMKTIPSLDEDILNKDEDAYCHEKGSRALGSEEHLELDYHIGSPSKWRAKLYILNGNGSWDDQGTGEFQVIKEPVLTTTKSGNDMASYQDTDYSLLLISEEEDQTELIHARVQLNMQF